MTADTQLYYDPYDFEIDTDPYPVWKRLREEAPLYYNAKHDFYALSRFDDVERGLLDVKTYSSARGSVLELIKLDMEMPPGIFIFEDPPRHDQHRGLLSRVFTPKKMAAIEPKVREFCARTLDRLVGEECFDFVADLGAEMPMRTIGYLLGIPEQDQAAIRDRMDQGLRIGEDGAVPSAMATIGDPSTQFSEYIDWRAKNPSDDLMTELLHAEFEDEHGDKRNLTREEILNYCTLIAGAGNETTTRLIGWTGKVPAEPPGQPPEVVADRGRVPAAGGRPPGLHPDSPGAGGVPPAVCRRRWAGGRGQTAPAA